MAFSLDHVVFFGRTWEECMGMYALEASELGGRTILDCAGGPDGLVGGGLERGIDITAVDPQYSEPPDVLDARGRSEIASSMRAWQSDPAVAFEPDVAADYEAKKLEALAAFIAAYRNTPDRFVTGALPDLPFSTGAFDLVLSGHFLFLYASLDDGGMLEHNAFDLDFHIRAVHELVRVGREVRIFPTYTTHGPPRRQPYVEPVMAAMREAGHAVQLTPANWVQGNLTTLNDVLVIRRTDGPG
ncbi:MAG: hypothetical protein QF733_09600 [Phycisphaerales bacterium]|jgi:hypothetical protein|nr:hypothetical protein [Phycisphaerales bacterium]